MIARSMVFFAILALAGGLTARADTLNDHVIHTCAEDPADPGRAADGRKVVGAEVDIHDAVVTNDGVLHTGEDQYSASGYYWLEYGPSGSSSHYFEVWGDVSHSLFGDTITITGSNELIGNKPVRSKFVFDRESLRARLTYRKWDGLLALGSPDFAVEVRMICRAAK